MTQKNSELISNKRAFHEYEILETFEAGIMLQGTEVKSLRDHGGNIQDAYVKTIKNELWLIGSSISPYRFGSVHNHEEKRDRKLLMHKREISRLKSSVQEKGFTLIPLSLYLKEGRVKVKLGLAKGKTKGDKRESIKERDEKRRMQKLLRNHG